MMRQRCSNPKARSFKNYGGRGIAVCKEWESFEVFAKDVGPRPSKNHSLDRINNDGNYEPGNVRWAIPIEQHGNKRNNILLTIDGQTKTVTQWAREKNLNPSTLHKRLFRSKWDPLRALSVKP